MSLIDDYFQYQEKYEKLYGEKTIVLMEVGKFFEIYGIVNDSVKKGRIYEIGDIINLTISKKNSKTKAVGQDNPLMAGFPNYAISKWSDNLLKHGYTVVLIEQQSHGTKSPTRKVTQILSPGTNMHTNSFSNYLMSIYLEQINDHRTHLPIMIVGISFVDITTGKTIVYETHSTTDDYKFALDEVFRFIQTFSPIEIIIHNINIPMNQCEICSYLELSTQIIHYNNYISDHYLEPKYSDAILQKVYPTCGCLKPVEYIHLEKMPFALYSYIFLIQFTYEHNENIIFKLEKPIIWEPYKYLVLSHDAVNQLHVISDKNVPHTNGISSLWDILNKTTTSMGKRLLKHRLLHPILDKQILLTNYDIIESLQSEYQEYKLYDMIRTHIKSIYDIERLHRRMAIKLFNPLDMTNLDMSYSSIFTAIDFIRNCNNSTIQHLLPDVDVCSQFQEFVDDYTKTIKIDSIIGIQLNNITENIFKDGIYPEIDSIQSKIDNCKKYFESLGNNLHMLIDTNHTNSTKSYIELKYNERDGHYLTLTKARSKCLKTNLSKKTTILIKTLHDEYTVNYKDLEFKDNTGICKIFSGTIRQLSHSWIGYQEKMKTICLQKFSELLYNYYNKYNPTLQKISKFIAEIDFYSCLSKVSYDNGYSRPTIDLERETSYIEATDVRHPIIEKVKDNIKYVANNVILGKDNQYGMLLYGVNAVGKSSYMKSIGLSVIMAQSGCFVPAKSFTYVPYKYLFTRISSSDNIFKGQSTFAVEMSELRGILKRSNEYSLVLGDELCSGTETTSGLAIVAAGVLRLSNNKSSFVFATHLHSLSELDEIKNCTVVHNYHMETIYDESQKTLIYNRKLKSGSGSSIYGLEVAKAMDLDRDFINCANDIRKKIKGIHTHIVPPNNSSFNSNVIIQNCSICKSPATEVHHIQEQHLANKDGLIDTFHKNSRFNLSPLCHACHHNVHHGKLVIDGFIDTSNGVVLTHYYTKNNSTTKGTCKGKKFNTEHINFIKSTYEKTKSYTKTKQILLSTYSLTISNPLIKKINNNEY